MLSYAAQPGVTRSRLKRKCAEVTRQLRSEMTQAEISEAVDRINRERPDVARSVDEALSAALGQTVDQGGVG